MKNIIKFAYASLASLLAVTFVSCTDSFDYEGPGEQDPGAFINAVATTLTYAAEDEQVLTFTLQRTNFDTAESISLIGDNSNFQVPTSVSFDAGEEKKFVNVPFNIKGGTTEKLTISVAPESATVYGNGSLTFTITRDFVWTNIGTGYWVDGIVASLFGVDASIPYVVEIEKIETETGVRFRFNGPYSHVATDFDGIGYVGYVYNDEGDCDEKEHQFVIDVTPAGATLQPVEMGMDWGYGAFSTGTVVGNLSSGGQVITDTNTYPLGVYDEAAGIVTFPAKSLYVRMVDEGVYITSVPSYLYLSADAYNAALGR
ncbi:MAG: hypothetical protein J1E57_06905 [Prevotella sp.]|nr:hypothetical protein [Prevotella sp.]